MWEEPFDGSNDYTDAELKYIIDRAHKLGKIIDVHCGGHNIGLRRMLAFDIDTLEHPFYGNEIIDWDIIQGYVKKGVVVVRSSRVPTGVVGRNVELDDDKLGFIASDELNPQKSRILLTLALLKQRTPADIQKLYSTY